MKLFAPILLIIGLFLPPGTLTDALRANLVTFFGLLSAGMVPAMTLLLTAPPLDSQSVLQAQKLAKETKSLLSGLMRSLALIISGGVLVLVSGAWNPQIEVSLASQKVAELVASLPDRAIQSLIFALFVLSLDRLRLVVLTFETVRNMRNEITVEKARAKINKLASDDDVREMFKRSPDHGRTVKINNGNTL